MIDAQLHDVDYISAITLSDHARKSYYDAAEKAEKAAQDMATIAMQTIVSAMSLNANAIGEEFLEGLDDKPSKDPIDIEEGKANNSQPLPTKLTELEQILEARKRAEKAAEEMASTALSTVMEAMKKEAETESKSKKEKAPAVKKEQEVDDKWYLFWSEEHRREYYYQPSTNTSLWQIPGKDGFSISPCDETSKKDEPTRSCATSVEVEVEEDPMKYDMKYCMLDGFFSKTDLERDRSGKKKKNGTSKRAQMRRNRRQRIIIWSSVSATILVGSTVVIEMRPYFLNGRIANDNNDSTESEVRESLTGKGLNTERIEQVQDPGSRRASYISSSEDESNGIFAIGHLKIPSSRKATDGTSRRKVESQEEIGIHSSMRDLANEVELEPGVMNTLLQMFPSSDDSRQDNFKGGVQGVVNATKQEVIDDPPEWCKLPLLKQLHPECHRNSRALDAKASSFKIGGFSI